MVIPAQNAGEDCRLNEGWADCGQNYQSSVVGCRLSVVFRQPENDALIGTVVAMVAMAAMAATIASPLTVAIKPLAQTFSLANSAAVRTGLVDGWKIATQAQVS